MAKWKGFGVAAACFLLPAQIAGAAETERSPEPMGFTQHVAHPRHTLTIISSINCTFCRAFDEQTMPRLRQRAEAIGLQYTVVPYLLRDDDIATTMAIACGPQADWSRRMTILFRGQSMLQSNRLATSQTKATASADPQQLAKASGLYAMAPSIGLKPAAVQSCMENKKLRDTVKSWTLRANQTWHVQGTPTFIIDGRPATASEVKTLIG